MQVAIHLGAHCTDEDRLLRTLLANKGTLATEGISVPGPGRYRSMLTRAVQKLRGEVASSDAHDVLIDAIVDDDSTRRVVLSYDDFICVPGRVFENGVLYDKAGYKPAWLRRALPRAEVEFFLAIRNPASFVPAVFRHKRQSTQEFRLFLNGVDLDMIRWSDVVLSIKETNPETPLTVWCNEDTPLIWTQVMREFAGCAEDTRLKGGFDVLAGIMQREGMRRMRSYLASHPPKTEAQRRRILAAFLDKYANDDAVEEVLDVPGWTQSLVERMTQNYDEDIAEIRGMAGVRLIEP